jgi:predicted RNA-binding protein with PIN domain
VTGTGEVEPVFSPAEPAETVGPLPEVVRSRVIAIATDCLGRIPVDQLPAPLKRVAAFTPARRAKLAGNQIVSVVETDESFRESLARQVRAGFAELAHALESGAPPAAADPAELAAVAYLLRPPGWTTVVTNAAEAAAVARATATSRQVGEQVERVRRQLDSATEELRDTRQKTREQVAGLKADNSDLRHKLNDSRSRTRAAETAAQKAEQSAAEVADTASAALVAHEAVIRRLRARIDELERELSSTRRSERVEKGSETLRARLLLDTLLETAQGLRRELALPAVEGSPADAVEAFVAEHGSRTPTSHGSLASDDPALLDQLLTLPRVHLIVDGYNVTKNAWPETSLERQRDRLLASLAPLAARSGAEVTVVFDAAESKERPLVNKPRGVRVLYSPMGVIADDVIRDLVAAEPRGRPLVVVSSDQAVVRDVLKAGARAVASPALSRLLSRF